MIEEKVIDELKHAGVRVSIVQEGQVLPLVLSPARDGIDLNEFAQANKSILKDLIGRFGGLLFRGFDTNTTQKFQSFVEVSSGTPLEYTERSSPRSKVSGGVYTSTNHPQDEEIFLHCEQSYNLSFPLKIYFYCQEPASIGGYTPIADTRKIFKRISADTRDQFIKRHYRYSRYFWPMLSMTWQNVFQTRNKNEVEAYCEANDIHYQWQSDDALSTYQVRPAVARHPVTKELCWFNHCTFFNLLALDQDTLEMFLDSFEEGEFPNQTYFGDGGKIEEAIYRELRDAYEAEKVQFDWKKNDILMLDNMLCAHGRSAYQGDRKVLAAMSEPIKWADTEYKESLDESD